MISNKAQFISTLHSIWIIPNDMDMETFMMAMTGIMQGHMVLWKPLFDILTEEEEYWLLEKDKDDWKYCDGPGYFEYTVNGMHMNDLKLFTDLCDRCLDFDLLEKGNKVDFLKQDYPY